MTADPATRVALAFFDEEGTAVVLDPDEAVTLLALTDDLDAATVSACPHCRSRVLACLALVDLLDDGPPHPRSDELVELADDAPSSHCYVEDRASSCRHPRWLDPGRLEWEDVLDSFAAPPRGPRR